MYCLSPPLDELPQGDWFCPDCIAAANDAEDIGFNSGKTFTIEQFKEECARFDAQFFGQDEPVSIPDIEEAFWKMVEEGSGKSVDVYYGADLDTSVHGSAFPRTWDADHGPGKRPDEHNAAAEHPWNLNNLPSAEGEHPSLLRQVNDHIPGVIVPWLYVGSTFSSFCWHFEDHMLCKRQLQPCGRGQDLVRGSRRRRGRVRGVLQAGDARPVRGSARSAPPARHHALALSLVEGVPVYRTDQHAGEFVVTFPKSYHGGFNTGFNVAEAVNFAPPDWLRFGYDGVERYRLYRKPSVLCHDELLCVAAADSPSEETARWLIGDLRRLTNEERGAREQLLTDGVVRTRRYTPRKLAAATMTAKNAQDARASAGIKSESDGASPEADAATTATRAAMDAALDPLDDAESLLPTSNANGAYDRECTICRFILHLSGVACSCNPDRAACLRHSAELCECPNSHRVMFYRKSIAQLERLCANTERACGKRAKVSEKEKAYGVAKLRQKRAAAWVKRAKEALEQKSPPTPTTDLEAIMIAAEEFTWAGTDMDDVRKMAANVSIAIAFQKELAILKRRINLGEDETVDGRTGWEEPELDDADIVVAAAAGAPLRRRRGVSTARRRPPRPRRRRRRNPRRSRRRSRRRMASRMRWTSTPRTPMPSRTRTARPAAWPRRGACPSTGSGSFSTPRRSRCPRRRRCSAGFSPPGRTSSRSGGHPRGDAQPESQEVHLARRGGGAGPDRGHIREEVQGGGRRRARVERAREALYPAGGTDPRDRSCPRWTNSPSSKPARSTCPFSPTTWTRWTLRWRRPRRGRPRRRR